MRSSNLESWSQKFDKADSPQTHRETGNVTAGTSCPQTWGVCLSVTRAAQHVCPQGRVGEESTASISGLFQGSLWQTTSCTVTEGLVRHPNLMKSTWLHLHFSLYIVNSLGGEGRQGGLSACFLNSHQPSFTENTKTFLMIQFSSLGFALSPSAHCLLHTEFS